MPIETYGASPDDIPDTSPPVADDPQQPHPPHSDMDIPERFKDAVDGLSNLAERPVAEHPQAFDDVHQRLRQQLDASDT